MLRLLLCAVVPATLPALFLAACTPADAPSVPPVPTRETSDAPLALASFALVELFTSEGCSSCPPANDLLGALAGCEGVVALSFHVDYWNGLGWRDPYSDAAYSARQRAYARRIPGGVYTSQMVVNGTAGFVGSRQREAEARVRAALVEPPPVAVTVAARPEGDEIAVDYTASGAPAGAVVHVVLAERAAAQTSSAARTGGGGSATPTPSAPFGRWRRRRASCCSRCLRASRQATCMWRRGCRRAKLDQCSAPRGQRRATKG